MARVSKTTGLKRKCQDPLPFIRWVGIAKRILEHVTWRRAWVSKDRLAFIRQFSKEGIEYFIQEGLEEWREPFAKELRRDRAGPLSGGLAGSEPESPLAGVD